MLHRVSVAHAALGAGLRGGGVIASPSPNVLPPVLWGGSQTNPFDRLKTEVWRSLNQATWHRVAQPAPTLRHCWAGVCPHPREPSSPGSNSGSNTVIWAGTVSEGDPELEKGWGGSQRHPFPSHPSPAPSSSPQRVGPHCPGPHPQHGSLTSGHSEPSCQVMLSTTRQVSVFLQEASPPILQVRKQGSERLGLHLAVPVL